MPTKISHFKTDVKETSHAFLRLYMKSLAKEYRGRQVF